MIKLAKDKQFSTTSREKWMDRKLNWQQLMEKDNKSCFRSQTPAFCWPADSYPHPHHNQLLKRLELAGVFNNCFYQYSPLILFYPFSTAKVKDNSVIGLLPYKRSLRISEGFLGKHNQAD